MPLISVLQAIAIVIKSDFSVKRKLQAFFNFAGIVRTLYNLIKNQVNDIFKSSQIY